MIEAINLSKHFGPNRAVSDINFKVEKGEILGLLGPNGAGKTTTMRLLTGFLDPSEGRAVIGGHDMAEYPIEAKRRIGYLPEIPPVYPEMRVTSYLEFVGRLKGISRKHLKERVNEVVRKCALADVRYRIVGRLSKGYRQRVGLAQALINSPDVLILDEPTAGLDPKQIIETRQLIGELGGEHTIILSTHILPEVEQTCQRVIIINEGRVVAADTPQNLTVRLRGFQTVRVVVEGPASDVFSRLRALEGVHEVEEKKRESGAVTFEVSSEKGRDIRRELAKKIVESGWGLIEMQLAGMSLEDVFLKLTAAEEEPTAEGKPTAEGETSGEDPQESEPA